MSNFESVFDNEVWYRERAEPEVRRVGVLEPRREVLGPAERGGLTFALAGSEGVQVIYAAGIENRLVQLTGTQLTVYGKLVLVDGAIELWIGRLAVDESC